MYNMYKILYYYYSSAISPQQFCPNKKDKSCMVQNNAKFKTERNIALWLNIMGVMEEEIIDICQKPRKLPREVVLKKVQTIHSIWTGRIFLEGKKRREP